MGATGACKFPFQRYTKPIKAAIFFLISVVRKSCENQSCKSVGGISLWKIQVYIHKIIAKNVASLQGSAQTRFIPAQIRGPISDAVLELARLTTSHTKLKQLARLKIFQYTSNETSGKILEGAVSKY